MAPVFLFTHTFYISIPVVFPLHPPIRSTSLLKAISQSCSFTEGFPHIQTAMSQIDAVFMQIWKGPNIQWCWGTSLLVDFSQMWQFWKRECALLRTEPCPIIEPSDVSLLHHGLDVSSANTVLDGDVTDTFKRSLWTVETAALDFTGFEIADHIKQFKFYI